LLWSQSQLAGVLSSAAAAKRARFHVVWRF
jgi:hypothetical protein